MYKIFRLAWEHIYHSHYLWFYSKKKLWQQSITKSILLHYAKQETSEGMVPRRL